ncbi:MAG: SRPBCC family protein [Planctomycetota bacterium]|nr:MAG: SRPBCC family protein [Planctomycetota bacterium]
MKPITFSCTSTLDLPPQAIVERILDMSNWPEFQGYGMLPGIKHAEFEVRTPELVGTRIRVENTDGSRHVEQIVAWQPGERLTLHLQEFSPPVSRLAERFEETWEFDVRDSTTHVTRAFRVHPKSALTWPMMWLVSRMLKKAIDKHLEQMRAEAASV